MSGFNSDIKTSMENSRNCLRRIARHDEKQYSKDSLVNIMEKFVKTVNSMDETILVPCRLMDRQVGDSNDFIQPAPKTSASHQLNMHGINGVKGHKHRQLTVHEFLNSADLFNLYTLLNSLKNDLLWTRNEHVEDNTEDIYDDHHSVNTLMSQVSICSTISSSSSTSEYQQPQQQSSSNQQNAVPQQQDEQQQQQQQQQSKQSGKGHARRPSTASMTSANSVSNLSDSESEISNENDSGMESEGNCNGSQSGGSTTGSSSGRLQQNTDRATELARQCRQHLAGLHRCLEQMTEAANYLTARYQSDVGHV